MLCLHTDKRTEPAELMHPVFGWKGAGAGQDRCD